MRVELVAREGVFRNANDWWKKNEPRITTMQSYFWSEQENTQCRPLVEKAVKKHLNKKYGKGKPIRSQWEAILATGRKPGG